MGSPGVWGGELAVSTGQVANGGQTPDRVLVPERRGFPVLPYNL